MRTREAILKAEGIIIGEPREAETVSAAYQPLTLEVLLDIWDLLSNPK